ncbi:MAG TPA: dTDP-4-dehydrorhamnose reductase [Chitinophagaceae bacterium]|nr:dTDP-4-dehydrorhamnose reductase [Chitinophagaceae bacterium]
MKQINMNDSFSFEKTILVTGSGGQLGMELSNLSKQYPNYKFLFTSKEDLPIDDFKLIKKYFEQQQIDYCINCAGYTAVDKAESEKEKAFDINADAVGNLSAMCKAHQAQLIHISSDYVFDGTSAIPYKEDDRVSPINVYGSSKLKGEELVLNNNSSAIIIRTSWVYSSFGNNFVKTMLRLLKEKETINVVSDQYGCPTYAADLAAAIMTIVDKEEGGNPTTGIFNFCNEGTTTWYDFAKAIKKFAKSSCTINPIPSSEYPMPAKRPQYSVLDTTKIKDTFDITIPKWKESLHKCLEILN